MKSKTILIVLLVVVVAVIGIFAAVKRGGGKEEIRIGGNFELTGNVASFGNSTLKGVQLALEQANASGELKKKVVLVQVDNKSDVAEAANMATKLVEQDKVVALVGPVISTNAISAGKVAQSLKVPMISPTATNPVLTEIGEYVFRACFIDDFQGRVMADFAYNQLGSRRAAILFDNGSDYAKGLSKYFKETFTQLGGTIVAEEAYLAGDTEFKPQLTKINAAKADMIYIPGYYQEQGLIARQARQMGINVPLTGGDGWDSSELVNIAGAENLNQIYFTNHYSPDDNSPNVQSFVAAYKEKYNGEVPDALAALGYEGGRLLINAINNADPVTPENIQKALSATKNFPGLGGEFTFDENRNPIKSAVIIELVNGKQVFKTVVQP
ncbi:MAG TPA: ABC transporter substrate-binding protein [Firmicutes bacterium]|nr:ABC transporter substrate-binding protein [Bacillota bacterium]